MIVTTGELLGIFETILNGQAERADWLALADAYEESGAEGTAETIREGTDPEKMERASEAWFRSVEEVAENGSCWSDEARSLLGRVLELSPRLVVGFADEEEGE